MERVKSLLARRPREPNPDDVIQEGPNGAVGVPRRHLTHPLHHNDPRAPVSRPHPAPQTHHPQQHPQHPQPHHPPQQHRPPPVPGDGQQEPITKTSATRTGQLQIALQNDTGSSNCYAYITGQAIDNGNALFLLSSDARTPYYPANPGSTGVRLTQNISINLGGPGNVVYATIPRLAGGRIWFSVGQPLTFAVNPGPGLVEPSVFNQADPNIDTHFGFAEFTFNSSQVFANISYVDFVGEPIALTLQDTSGAIQHVSGMPANGLQTVANGLRAQTARDGRRWSSLIENNKQGQLLRILSPNSGILLNPSWFQTYWTSYVNQVYNYYSTHQLTVDTQAGYGNVGGHVNSAGALDFGAGGSFGRPTAADIFSCSTGPFATGQNGETNTIIPRLAAAFNRSTMLVTNNQPDGANASQYYRNATTNHYARIVHAANLDGQGYAFPYDDVTPDGGVPQEGAVFSYSPALLTVTVGGRNAYVR